jgi:hypothetical protein
MNPRRRITKAVARKRPATRLALLGATFAIGQRVEKQLGDEMAAAGAKTDADWAPYTAMHGGLMALVDQIEPVPGKSLDDLCVKMRALLFIHSDDLDDLAYAVTGGDEPATDLRLVLSILRDLARISAGGEP